MFLLMEITKSECVCERLTHGHSCSNPVCSSPGPGQCQTPWIIPIGETPFVSLKPASDGKKSSGAQKEKEEKRAENKAKYLRSEQRRTQ